MVTMGKGELKLYMCSVIDSLEGEAYDRFCELFLTACGVVDADGNLTQEYADSPYWTGGTDGEPLRPAMAKALPVRRRSRPSCPGTAAPERL